MKLRMTSAQMAVIALSAVAALTPAMAQKPKTTGTLYAYHTGKAGACPGLDWHVVAQPDGSLSGFVAWDHMAHMAKLDGAMEKGRDFKMTATEVGGTSRVATVTGTATGTYINLTIDGAGTSCDGKVLSIPRVVGGLGGGGG